ncbi:type II secretion system protein, partial [Patescibacteria group bacterium]|nr:type II secretion system protein [Patescibacteria group bacterium]
MGTQSSNVKAQMSKSAGFGIIEIIVAMGIMIIIAATGASTVLHSFSANRLGDEETNATLFA